MDLMMDEDQNATSVFIDKHISVRIVVGLTCVLSMLGALSVILSYCCIRSLQSQGRLILLNLAVMDFGVGLFNLTGAIINFDEYYFNTTNGSSMINPGNPVEGLCKTQAFLAHFCTGSSVLWTSSLAIYMYIIVFHNHDRNIKFFLWICSIICYGFPLMLTTWLIFTDRLGHSPYTEAAWCGLIINNDTQPYGFPDLFAAIIGYDIWIYTTVALCSGIYVALFMYMHFMYEEARGLVGNRVFWKRALQFLDIKLIFIPIVFIFLKMWSSILLFLFYYCRVSPDNLPNPISQILIYFSGIGDSGQGFANGILFVFLTPIVRQKFILRFFNICKRKKPEVPDEQTSLVKKKIEYSPCASLTSSGVHSESEMN